MKGGVWACTPRLARLASPARHDAFIVESPRSSSERPRRPQVFDWRAEAALPRCVRTGLRACEHLHPCLPAVLGPQWHRAIAWLAYRCGGSAGLKPASRASVRPTIIRHGLVFALETTFKSAAYTLTCHGFSNRVPRMDADLDALEEKLAQLVQRLTALRDENRELRQQVAARTDENARLGEKLGAAKSRIEALLRQIPETET